MESTSILLINDNSQSLKISSLFLEEHPGITISDSIDLPNQTFEKAKELDPDIIPILRPMSPTKGTITLRGAPAYKQAALNTGADALVSKDSMHKTLIPAIDKIRGK